MDDDYNIIINLETDEKTIKKYRFYADRIKDYHDSLAVVMMAEFNDNDIAHVAILRIGYTMLRLGYQIWQTQKKQKHLL